MEMKKTKIIVLTSVKYKETSLIVKCFSMDDGLQSFMLKGIRKSNKSKFKLAYFQPLSMLEIIVNSQSKSNIKFIKEITNIHHFDSIHTNIVKQSLVFFLTEFIDSCLIEHQANEELFIFLEKMLLKLDELETFPNFHIVTMWEMTKHIGIYPKIKTTDNQFNAEEGRSEFSLSVSRIGLLELELIKKLDGINFDALNSLRLDLMERKIILILSNIQCI